MITAVNVVILNDEEWGEDREKQEERVKKEAQEFFLKKFGIVIPVGEMEIEDPGDYPYPFFSLLVKEDGGIY